jgi:hypothetical protein
MYPATSAMKHAQASTVSMMFPAFRAPVEFVHEPDGVTYCLVQQD